MAFVLACLSSTHAPALSQGNWRNCSCRALLLHGPPACLTPGAPRALLFQELRNARALAACLLHQLQPQPSATTRLLTLPIPVVVGLAGSKRLLCGYA